MKMRESAFATPGMDVAMDGKRQALEGQRRRASANASSADQKALLMWS
jgi:hypothetical protein